MIHKTAAFVTGALLAVSLAACAGVEDDPQIDQAPSSVVTETPSATKAAPQPTKPKLTTSQEQAVGMAKDYLEYSAFSRKSLIEQLKYEGFSTDDATFAVDHIKPDWMKQAARMAKEYLESSNYSRQGLIGQLKYEGFTTKQAEYGVKKAGL